MRKKLKSILLVDDDEATNFIHRLVIKQSDCAENIVIKENGIDALNYLKSEVNGEHPQPNLIFLDINMPAMDGWGFLEEYKALPKQQQADTVIVMLTTSLNPEDKKKASSIPEISDFISKPLTIEKMNKVHANFFLN
ncbi:response regulator [Flagellimonas hymeniacidonis]|uniref:Response regulator n=1 Tax=Flagellimonas hymeniacidonis TaxID=2603628 RepID=A0A5C8V5K7_9FLAO|nr:response regulator [Flagellimonas hymeniacidonis]TXN36058.1 response regulator [Flagellimonas hymeniacidonis]